MSTADTAKEAGAPVVVQVRLWDAVLAADHANPDATAAITALASPPTTVATFAGAEALADAGLKAEARAAIADAITNGAKGPIPKSLKGMVGDHLSLLEQARNASDAVVTWVVGPLLLLMVAWVIARCVPVRPKRRFLAVGDAIPDDPGVTWSGALRVRLRKLGSENVLKLDSSPGDANPTLPSLADLDSRLKVLDWIVAQRARRRRATLACSLYPDIRAGGVSVELEHGWDRYTESATLWSPGPAMPSGSSAAEIAERLVGLVAGWAGYKPEEAGRLGTTSRVSYAFNVAASDALANGALAEARLLAARAHAEDPGNLTALVNMAIATDRLAYATNPTAPDATLLGEAEAMFRAAIL